MPDHERHDFTALVEISRHNNRVLRIKSYNKQRKLQEKELSQVTSIKNIKEEQTPFPAPEKAFPRVGYGYYDDDTEEPTNSDNFREWQIRFKPASQKYISNQSSSQTNT